MFIVIDVNGNMINIVNINFSVLVLAFAAFQDAYVLFQFNKNKLAPFEATIEGAYVLNIYHKPTLSVCICLQSNILLI